MPITAAANPLSLASLSEGVGQYEKNRTKRERGSYTCYQYQAQYLITAL